MEPTGTPGTGGMSADAVQGQPQGQPVPQQQAVPQQQQPQPPVQQQEEGLKDPFAGLDWNTVPENLRGTLQERFKQLNTDYTKGKMEAAEVKRKYTNFDELIRTPEFLEWGQTKMGQQGVDAYGNPIQMQPNAQQLQQSQPGVVAQGEPEVDFSDPKQVQSYIQQQVQNQTLQTIRPLAAQYYYDRVSDQDARLRGVYANYDQYVPKINALTRQVPSINREEAYWVIAGKENVKTAYESGKNEGLRGVHERPQGVGGPIPPGGPAAPSSAKTVEEAFTQAEAQRGRDYSPSEDLQGF